MTLITIHLSPYIPSTIIGVIGLISGYAYLYLKNRTDKKLAEIQSTVPSDRLHAIEVNINEIGVHVDTSTLTPDQKYNLLGKLLKAKTRKYLIIAITTIILSILAALLVAQNAPSSVHPKTPDPITTDTSAKQAVLKTKRLLLFVDLGIAYFQYITIAGEMQKEHLKMDTSIDIYDTTLCVSVRGYKIAVDKIKSLLKELNIKELKAFYDINRFRDWMGDLQPIEEKDYLQFGVHVGELEGILVAVPRLKPSQKDRGIQAYIECKENIATFLSKYNKAELLRFLDKINFKNPDCDDFIDEFKRSFKLN